jgi:hypothetical protein
MRLIRRDGAYGVSAADYMEALAVKWNSTPPAPAPSLDGLGRLGLDIVQRDDEPPTTIEELIKRLEVPGTVMLPTILAELGETERYEACAPERRDYFRFETYCEEDVEYGITDVLAYLREKGSLPNTCQDTATDHFQAGLWHHVLRTAGCGTCDHCGTAFLRPGYHCYPFKLSIRFCGPECANEF